MATLDRLSAPILHRDSPVITVLATGANTSTYKIEQVLLDSGASQNCINRLVVEKLGLPMIELPHPLEFSAAGGHIVRNTHETTLTLNIAGIEQTILCYVEDREHHFNLMLGMPALAQFRMGMEFAAGPCRETIVTITKDLRVNGRAVTDGKVKVVLETGYKTRPFGELMCVKLEREEDVGKVNGGNETVEMWERRRREEVERYAELLMGMV